MTEEERIAVKYKAYGVTPALVKSIVQTGEQNGISHKAALIGARLALSQEFGVNELFSPEDLAEVTGQTVEEVNQVIEENEEELFRKGGIYKVSFGYRE